MTCLGNDLSEIETRLKYDGTITHYTITQLHS